jgi:PAS domain S-box-containing protein
MSEAASVWRRLWRHPVGRYAAAAVLTVGAALLRALVHPLVGGTVPFIFFYPSLLASGLLGGLGPGIFSMIAAALLSTFFMTSGAGADLVGIVLFFLVCGTLLFATETARRAGRKLEQDGRRRQELLDRLQAGLVFLGPAWRFRFVNAEAQKLIGASERELLGRDARSLFGSDPTALAKLDRVLAYGETVDFETFHDAWKRWLLVRAFPVPEGFAIFFLDVTQRKRDEAEAAQSRELLWHALEAGGMGYWSWDIASGEVTWSDNLEAIHGLPAGAFDGTFEGFMSLVHPEDRDAVRSTIERAVREGTDYKVDFRVPRPDGSVRWIAGIGHAVLEDGRPVRLIGLGMNVTDRKQRELDRRRLAAIVSSSDDAIISKDLEGRITSWNRAAERMFGYTEDEAVGQTIALILPDDRPDDFRQILVQIREGKRVEQYETRRRRKDGAILDVSLSVSPIRDDSGRIVGASKIARDITEAKRAEAELARTRDLFLGMLGHDLRNPLNTIVSSLYSLEKQANDASRPVFGRVSRAAERMTRLISQLLDFTRARLGAEIPVSPVPGDLVALCAASVEELEARHPDRIRFSSEGPVPGLWDPDRLAQIVSNLVVNALQHGSTEEPVSVRVASSNGRASIEVVNCGRSIPEEDRFRIFEPFSRAAGDSSAGGVGLGLYIVREIVRSHGGTIEVESGGGQTRFTVQLPVRAAG